MYNSAASSLLERRSGGEVLPSISLSTSSAPPLAGAPSPKREGKLTKNLLEGAALH